MGTQVKLDGDAGRWYSHLTLGLQTLRSSNALCDASLVSQDGHVVPVHSVVMAAGSSVLEVLMKSNRNDDNDENHVFLDDVTTGSVLTSIVDFVYTASCDVSSNNLEELCSAARALKLHHLQELCVNKFKGAANAIDFHDANASNNNNDEKTLSKNKATSDNDDDNNGDGNPDDEEEEVKKDQRISNNTKDRLRQALQRKHSVHGENALNAEGGAEAEEEQGVYVCKFCSKMFAASEQLHRHESSEHRSEEDDIDNNIAADSNEDDHDVSDNDAEVSNLMTSEARLLMTSKSTGFFFDDSSDGIQNIPDCADEDSNLSASLAGVGGASGAGTPRGDASLSPSSVSRLTHAHQQQTQQSKKRFFCNLCDSSFTRRDNLKTHKKAKHEGQQPFDCPKCGR